MQTESLFLDIHLKETDNEDAAQVEIKYISIDSDNDVIGTIVDVLMFVPALGQYITVLDHLMLEFMKKAKFEYDVKIERKELFPDVVVEIATKESIDSIISIFKKIPDSHVILETIQPKKLYTGDRES